MKENAKRANEYHRLRKAFQIVAGILASRAWGCGTCPPAREYTEVYTPPGNGDAGGSDGGLPVLDQAECDRICGTNTISCSYASTDASGAVVVSCRSPISCGAGRRPDGFRAASVQGLDPVGAWLATVADLEAASVDAFRALDGDLARLGAPSRLRRRARAAAADEVRHAATMRGLARRRGASAGRRPKMVPARERAAVEVAIENAVEGCVRETFAAFVATVQAEHATDPAVRAAMRRIARDETRHAALAHAVDAWLHGVLGASERAAVERARQEAIARLEDEAPIALGDVAREALGIPEAAELRRAARALGAVAASSAARPA